MIPFPFQQGGFGRVALPETGGGGGGYLYFRIYCTTNNGGTLDQITEIEVAETTGGANVCTGGTPTASNQYLTFGPDLAFDGVNNVNNNSWVGNGGAERPYWVKYQFPSARVIAEVRMWGAVSSVNDRGPRDFLLQGSNDNSNWDTLKTLTGESWTGDYEQKTYVI